MCFTVWRAKVIDVQKQLDFIVENSADVKILPSELQFDYLIPNIEKSLCNGYNMDEGNQLAHECVTQMLWTDK